MTTRADERRQQRRRQALEPTGRTQTASADRDAAASAGSADARWATVRIAVAVACLLGAQFLHWSVIDQHAREWRASGNFFLILALAEGLVTILVIAKLRPWVAAVGIAISVVPVVVWAWDRTLGLPFGPTKGVRGTIGRSDVMSVVFELITVFALWPFLKPGHAENRATRLDVVNKAVIGFTVVYVFGFAFWAMVGDRGAIHGATATTPVAVAPAPSSTLGALNRPVALVPTQTLTYDAKEYSFAGPETITAGVTKIVVRNVGAQAHDLQVARIPPSSATASDVTSLQNMFADAQAATTSGPSIIADTHSIAAGQTSTVTVDLTAGRYMLGCANRTPDGTYHYAKGMLTMLTVTDPAATLPSTPAPAG